MDLQKLNNFASVSVKPQLKIQQMILNQHYPIINIKEVYSQKISKKCIVCELEEYAVFLPKRVSDNLNADDIEALNKQNLALVYLGAVDVGKINPASNIKFVLIGEDKSGNGDLKHHE